MQIYKKNQIFLKIIVYRDYASPIVQLAVQWHEVDLRGTALGRWEGHLVIALTQEFQLLRLFVHENTCGGDEWVLSGTYNPNLPSKWPVSTLRISMALLPQPIIWLVEMYASSVQNSWIQSTRTSHTNGGGNLTPLQLNILGDFAVGVHVDALICNLFFLHS